jgi:hypothetical protein
VDTKCGNTSHGIRSFLDGDEAECVKLKLDVRGLAMMFFLQLALYYIKQPSLQRSPPKKT